MAAIKKKTVKSTPRKPASKITVKKKDEVVEEVEEAETLKKTTKPRPTTWRDPATKKMAGKVAVKKSSAKKKTTKKAATTKTVKPERKKSSAKVVVAVVIVFIIFAVIASLELFTGTSETEEPIVEDTNEEVVPIKNVRPPSVAGVFYPEGKSILEEQIQSLLWNATNWVEDKDVSAIIAPHAALRYSGSVDASAYKTVAGKDFNRVIIMASAHQMEFEGVALSEYDAWRTPIGEADVDKASADLVDDELFRYNDAAFVDEHPIELHVPFVQYLWPEATIIPIIVGQIEDEDRQTIADKLTLLMDGNTLLVISSDLSHYLSADEAEPIDENTLKTIESLNPDASEIDACGKDPILVADILARANGWVAKVLDYANTGDTTSDDTRVVGYGAVAYGVPTEGVKFDTLDLTDAQKSYLIKLARSTVERYVTTGNIYEPIEPVDEKMKEDHAVFVTLNKDEELRGCIGTLEAEGPLYLAVRDNAIAAASNDPRFEAVTEEELASLTIEVSVLSDSTAVELNVIQPGVDGVTLKQGNNSATFLPTVWEQFDSFEEFMQALSEKAGLSKDAWLEANAEFARYRATSFSE